MLLAHRHRDVLRRLRRDGRATQPPRTLTLGNMTMYVIAFRQMASSRSSRRSGRSARSTSTTSTCRTSGSISESDRRRRPSRCTRVYPPRPRAARIGAGERRRSSSRTWAFVTPASTWALRHVHLTISRAASSLALVGENGAGKTTLVKLLTRLYEPTEGRILLDGRDLRAWPPDVLRRRFGVLFQDFNQYQLRVRENVGFGSVENMGRPGARVERAVARGGAGELVSSLTRAVSMRPSALLVSRTARSSRAGNGRRSRWLARSCARTRTSSCSTSRPRLSTRRQSTPSSRAFAEARGGGERPPSSSRTGFPTVARMARKIVVLDHGTVAESGTHDELVARGGRYARMFTLQAEGYR